MTKLSEWVQARDLKTGRSTPNGNMATAHAEIVLMQQAYEKGLTKGENLTMSVYGKEVCGYCRADIVPMAEAVGLKSIKIFEHESGNVIIGEGMKPFIEYVKQ